jgi:hypothetical protein
MARLYGAVIAQNHRLSSPIIVIVSPTGARQSSPPQRCALAMTSGKTESELKASRGKVGTGFSAKATRQQKLRAGCVIQTSRILL